MLKHSSQQQEVILVVVNYLSLDTVFQRSCAPGHWQHSFPSSGVTPHLPQSSLEKNEHVTGQDADAALSWKDLCCQSSLRGLWRKAAGKTRPVDEFLNFFPRQSDPDCSSLHSYSGREMQTHVLAVILPPSITGFFLISRLIRWHC